MGHPTIGGIAIVSATNRRIEYRVAQFERHGLRASILVGEHRVAVELLDTTYSGAGILVGPSYSAEPGLPVLLEFSANALRDPMLVQGVVRHTKEVFSGQRLGVSFRDARELDGQLPPSLIPVFNRRNCYRVSPVASPGLKAECTAMGDSHARMRLLDVSLSGVGLLAGLPEDRILQMGEVTTISFHLPNHPAPIVTLATVLYEESLPGGMRYGVRYIPDKCDDFQTTERAIGDYILNRQRSVLRRP
jgi:hypothetical protein